MSLAVVFSRAQDGVDAPLVTCEVHLSGGLPGTSIVGLPETAVKEARDRVRAAIQNARLDYPQRRITVNLAPADLSWSRRPRCRTRAPSALTQLRRHHQDGVSNTHMQARCQRRGIPHG
jgi:hypothetical protein